LLISTIRIADINNAICWYGQLVLSISTVYVHYWYRQFQMLISLIPIVDISNWCYCVHVLGPLISTIGIVVISNVRTLLISTIPIVTISKAQSQQYKLLILAYNCLFWQFELLISHIVIVAIGIMDINNVVHCDMDNRMMSITLIQIADIDKFYYCVYVSCISKISIVDIYNVRTLLISTIIDNSNCRLSIIYERIKSDCWYRKFVVLIWTIQIADIGN